MDGVLPGTKECRLDELPQRLSAKSLGDSKAKTGFRESIGDGDPGWPSLRVYRQSKCRLEQAAQGCLPSHCDESGQTTFNTKYDCLQQWRFRPGSRQAKGKVYVLKLFMISNVPSVYVSCRNRRHVLFSVSCRGQRAVVSLFTLLLERGVQLETLRTDGAPHTFDGR